MCVLRDEYTNAAESLMKKHIVKKLKIKRPRYILS